MKEWQEGKVEERWGRLGLVKDTRFIIFQWRACGEDNKQRRAWIRGENKQITRGRNQESKGGEKRKETRSHVLVITDRSLLKKRKRQVGDQNQQGDAMKMPAVNYVSLVTPHTHSHTFEPLSLWGIPLTYYISQDFTLSIRPKCPTRSLAQTQF